MSEIHAPTPMPRNRLLPFRIRLEQRLEEPPGWYPALISAMAILAALVIGGIVIALSGADPFRSYAHIARASFGNIGVLSDTIVKATPLLFTGLACAIAFRMRLWNIGEYADVSEGGAGDMSI